MNDLFNDLDILKIYEWFNGLKSYAAVAYGLICACFQHHLDNQAESAAS